MATMLMILALGVAAALAVRCLLQGEGERHAAEERERQAAENRHRQALLAAQELQEERERQAAEKRERQAAEKRYRQALLAAQELQEERERQAAAERQQQLLDQLAMEVDLFIRTRRKFDAAHPTQYLCQISTIEHQLQSQISPRFTDWRKLLNLYDGTWFALSGDQQSVRVLHLTPFQGESSHRVFGYFSCVCGKQWSSAATWKDKWQQCKVCETKAYPYKQHNLEKRDEADVEQVERRPHDTARCQKCREKGSLCMPRLYYAAVL
eukprot:531250-Pleurochrysis_carterae.AAC.1